MFFPSDLKNTASEKNILRFSLVRYCLQPTLVMVSDGIFGEAPVIVFFGNLESKPKNGMGPKCILILGFIVFR